MLIAAVPEYLGKKFEDASPALRFGPYFSGWEESFALDKKQKVQAVQKAIDLRLHGGTLGALRQRQLDALSRLPAADGLFPKVEPFLIAAKATSPFTTGLGIEHPLENGFAFLHPYGLPYLPGSSVKGVLRRAAEELASGDWGESHGWSNGPAYRLEYRQGEKQKFVELSLIDVLFGREPPSGSKEHVRGALTFWDVIPQIPGKSLTVEIMTPHQGHYYQQKSERKSGDSITPHDSGQPIPIPFLTVPPGSGFDFHIVCDAAHLARLTARPMPEAPNPLESLDGLPRWQTLMTAAFEHAFQWLGFGAKTAVGYGALETPAMRETRTKEAEAQQARAKEATAKAKAEQDAANAVAWPGARLKFNRANKALTAEKDGRSAVAIAPKGEELLVSLPAEVRKKVETNQFVKVTAYVSDKTLVRVEAA